MVSLIAISCKNEFDRGWLNKARVNRHFREVLADYPASNE